MQILAALLIVPAVLAQPDVDHPWSDLWSNNPPGLEFSLRLVDPHPYRQGELIQMEVKFPGKPYAPGPPLEERWQFGGFLLDPPAECGSFAHPCAMQMGFSIDKSDPMLSFGDRADPIVFLLNNYASLLPPGTYRAAMLARKLVLRGRAPMSVSYGYPEPPEYVLSNAIEFEVTAPSPAWIEQTIAASVATLKVTQQPDTPEKYELRRAAAQQLRFLDFPSGWAASLSLLAAEENILLRGLAATREPARVCDLMQSRIPSPDQAVSTYYLSTMAQVCSHAQQPPVIEKGAAMLAASLANKRGENKAIAFEALLQRVQHLQINESEKPPEWIPSLTREFFKSFPTIDGWRKRMLLSLYASALPSPGLIPLLEAELDAWKPGDYYELPREALQALYSAAPRRAQARILAELRKPKTWLDLPQLDLLPASAAPSMDDDLIEERGGAWNSQLRMAALAKYATPQALPRIKALYESQKEPCQPELIAYFLRVDPSYADRVFRSQPWEMQADAPPCTVQYFQRTPPLAMHPVLEKYMSAYLMHRSVFIKNTVARSLAVYGSKATLPPLWGALRYFHAYWNGKKEELEQNRTGVDLEVELRNAIARGRNWLVTDSDLRAIVSLCISERCVYETQEDLRAWQKPLRIEVSGYSSDIHGTIAQYNGMETLASLKTKLSQFPPGTQFQLRVWGRNANGLAAEIRDFAASHGLSVTIAPRR